MYLRKAITVQIIMVGHRTFEDQLTCLSDQKMFASDIKDQSKDIGRCISHCLYMSSMYSVYVSYKNITPGC